MSWCKQAALQSPQLIKQQSLVTRDDLITPCHWARKASKKLISNVPTLLQKVLHPQFSSYLPRSSLTSLCSALSRIDRILPNQAVYRRLIILWERNQTRLIPSRIVETHLNCFKCRLIREKRWNESQTKEHCFHQLTYPTRRIVSLTKVLWLQKIFKLYRSRKLIQRVFWYPSPSQIWVKKRCNLQSKNTAGVLLQWLSLPSPMPLKLISQSKSFL